MDKEKVEESVSPDQSTASENNTTMTSGNKEDITNDGVKILEEVFGKASMGDDKEEAKNSSPSAENGSSPFGPDAPKDDQYDEDEIKKAEEFKTQGNEFFKSKFIFLVSLFIVGIWNINLFAFI
jgi:hypothetical protein